jgi:flavoprotein
LQTLQDTEPRARRCVQCFRDLPPDAFSKRQRKLLDGKCVSCVDALEKAASSTQPAGERVLSIRIRSIGRRLTKYVDRAVM